MDPLVILGIIMMVLGFFCRGVADMRLYQEKAKARKHPLAALIIAMSMPKWIYPVRRYSLFVGVLGVVMAYVGAWQHSAS